MRKDIQRLIRRITTSLIIGIQILVYPAIGFAQEATTSDVTPAVTEAPAQTVEATPEEPAVAPQQEPDPQPLAAPIAPQTVPTAPTGPQQPNGAASSTYTYNEATGLWENDYYAWDPVTKQTSPKTPQSYSYNPATNMWDTTEWYYSPEAGKYLANSYATAQQPASLMAPVNSITNTGPNSNNTIDNNGNSTATFDLFFDASVSNKIGQISQSGNASVFGNTFGGDATSGDAMGLVNLLNMLQSSWGSLGSDDIALFMANIDGNVTGDLMVNPNAIMGSSANTDIDVNVSSDAAILNDIDVDVATGNSTVGGNTAGGDATTGNAQAVVNLMNLINSAIRSSKSFVGVLNINGSLNGDILLPPGMLQAIIAATGPDSNNQIDQSANRSLDVTLNDNKTINNDITTDVSSGAANVSNNTNGGSASSGKAESNVVLLNLTGQKVVAKNAMLVFVNVMGSWVGLIFDAPAGTNAIAATGPNSNNTITQDHNLNVTLNETDNSLIDNNVNVSASSGDASVTGNTNGGNALSGDASIGINVLNMIDSDFEVTDWFGVLFINVFGSWVGSFGVNTAAGNAPASNFAQQASGATQPSPAAAPFAFMPKPTTISSANGSQGIVAGATSQNQPPTPNVQNDAAPASAKSNPGVSSAAMPASNLWLGGIAALIGALMLGGERLIALLRGRQVA